MITGILLKKNGNIEDVTLETKKGKKARSAGFELLI